MRVGRLAVALLSAVTVDTCVFPTENDSSVRVSLTPIHILFQGKDTTATAKAWRTVTPADSLPISNVVFVWTTSDSSIATVDPHTGHIVGVKSGTVIITAAAVNFDKRARAAADTLRVAAPLEIDSTRPKVLRYGEMLSVYGVGVNGIFLTSLSGAQLIRVPYSDTVFPEGTSRSKWWVPPPAHSDSLFFLGVSGGQGVFGYFKGDTTKVVERDLYEPNDTVPRAINLDAPPPFAVAPNLRFYNPALAFEVLKRDQKTGSDWYRLTQAQPRDLTLILTAPQIAGTFSTFLTDSLGWNGTTFFIGRDSWTFGPKSHSCHGLPFGPSEAVGDSTIVAFKNLPAGALDAIAIYGTPGRYGLAVIAGYQSELPADAHEDDNSCNAADLRGTAPLPVGGGLRDTLTIENPHDIDWIRFNVPSGGNYQFRLHALASLTADSLKDLDLYVIRVPAPSDAALSIVMADTAAGSEVNRTVPGLAAGDYYAVVLDFAGKTTKYEVCAAVVPLLPPAFCNTAWP